MSDVEWIKLTTDMFDNRKIKYIRSLPEGNNIVLIWVMLLTMAGRCNANGMIFLTENIPYTPQILADELNFEENTIRFALNVLEKLGMIVTNDGYFAIAGWEEYQNTEGLDKIREQTRVRVAKHRECKKLISCDGVGDTPVKESEKENTDYRRIVSMYNEICVSYPTLKTLSEKRMKSIKARLKTYSYEDFETLFKKAEASDFLKGGNKSDWSATFDWLICDSNMAKVLDGNYDNKDKKTYNFDF